MTNFISKSQVKDQNNVKLIEDESLNKYFEFNELKSNEIMDETFIYLKMKLSSFPEMSKDNTTIQLILSIFSLKVNTLKNDEIKIEFLINNIIKLMKAHDAFRYFIYNNHIDDKILLKIIPHLKYEHILKNVCFSKEGDISNKIYFILKGQVSFRKKVNNLRNSKLTEEEKYVLSNNDIFGQWDILYERKRKLSFHTLNNCHLITIEKEIFKRFLEEKILKGEQEKKIFVSRFLRNNVTLTANKIDNIILDMKVLHFKKGDIIYKEGDINKTIFLIYTGEVKLIKNVKNGEFYLLDKFNESIINLQKKAKNVDYLELVKNNDDKDDTHKNNTNYIYNKKYLKQRNNSKEKKIPITIDLMQDKSIYQDLIILGRGRLGGLEATTGILKAKYSMIANSDYTTLFQIQLINFEERLKELMVNLLPEFIKLEKEIHSRIKHIKYIDNKIVPLNCQKFKIDKRKKKNLVLNPLENNEVFFKEIKKINDKFDVNEGGFIKMNEFNLKLNNQKNLLKEQLIDNKRKDLKVDCYIKKSEDIENSKLRYTGVKMICKSAKKTKDKFPNINNNNNNFIDDISNNIENGIFSPNISRINKKSFFITNTTKKEKDSSNKKIKKEMSQINFTKKTLEIFDKVIENEKKKKKYIKMNLFNPRTRNPDISEKNMRSKTIAYISNNNNNYNLLKEVIIYQNKHKKNDEINSNSKTINTHTIFRNKFMNGVFSEKNKLNKNNNEKFLLKSTRNDNSDKDDNLIVNKNFLKKLFERNMSKIIKRNSIKNNDFNRNFHSKRMIYYNTGMYDMPLAFHLTLQNKSIFNK